MRLIDADDLISYIKSTGLGTGIDTSQKDIIEAIKNCPIAYDTGKVVEQLENLLEDNTSDSGDDWYTAECLNEAVDIVKGGGVE